MKTIGSILTMTAVVALVVAAQAFAAGGGTGVGTMGGSMGGGHSMSSGMYGTGGMGMHQGQMTNCAGPNQMPMNGTVAQGMMQGGAGNTAAMQHRLMHGGNSEMSGMHTTATTNTK